MFKLDVYHTSASCGKAKLLTYPSIYIFFSTESLSEMDSPSEIKMNFKNAFEIKIETEAVFTIRETNNEWNVDFLQNSHFGIQHKYSSEFSIQWSIHKTSLRIQFEFTPFYFF